MGQAFLPPLVLLARVQGQAKLPPQALLALVLALANPPPQALLVLAQANPQPLALPLQALAQAKLPPQVPQPQAQHKSRTESQAPRTRQQLSLGRRSSLAPLRSHTHSPPSPQSATPQTNPPRSPHHPRLHSRTSSALRLCSAAHMPQAAPRFYKTRCGLHLRWPHRILRRSRCAQTASPLAACHSCAYRQNKYRLPSEYLPAAQNLGR